jgi:hypothetical protein
VNRIIDRRPFLITVTLSVLVIGSFVLAAASFYRAHESANRDRLTLCRAQNQSNEALRKVLLLARASGGRERTPEQQARADAFFRTALSQVRFINCGAVSH